MRKVIRLSIMMQVDVGDMTSEDAADWLEDSHCVENHFAAIAARIAAQPGVCNCCRFATVEILPDGTEAYDPTLR